MFLKQTTNQYSKNSASDWPINSSNSKDAAMTAMANSTENMLTSMKHIAVCRLFSVSLQTEHCLGVLTCSVPAKLPAMKMI